MNEQQKAPVRARIMTLRTESRDSYFTQYLTKLGNDLDVDRAAPDAVAAEVERAYRLYCERMSSSRAPTETPAADPLSAESPGRDLGNVGSRQTDPSPAETPGTDPSLMPQAAPPSLSAAAPPVGAVPGEQSPRLAASAESTAPTKVEYTVGAVVLSIVGALFMLTAFITFGVNYLTGLYQGIFLYLLPAAIILFSELFVKSRLPKFSPGLTGLGIAALYAATIINFMYLKTLNSLAMAAITVIIAGFAFLLSRRRDSSVLRIISISGCYISFLTIGRDQSAADFLIAAGTVFAVNITGLFFAAGKQEKNVFHALHMSFNTIFILIFAVMAGRAGVGNLFIILGLILNIAFLNIVYLKQEKTTFISALFGTLMGIMGLSVLGVADGLLNPFQALSQQIYYALIVLLLMLASSVFFYIINSHRVGKAIQYYFFMSFALSLLLIDRIDHLYIWGIMLMFVLAKRMKGAEYEAMNALMTIVAFGVALEAHNNWLAWVFLALALLSVPLIRRWRLFYQYALSVYLLLFAWVKLPNEYDLFLPAAALILFLLVPVFKYLVPPYQEAEEKLALVSKIYNLTNLGAVGVISLLCFFAGEFWVGSLVTLIGALWLLFYVNPRFHLGGLNSAKHLILAGYLTVMTLITRFEEPIITSVVLMVIAVICVGFGFRINDKYQRFFGLVLAIFVCVKIGAYDFRETGQMQRMIVFMAVGAASLLISLLYIRLEKARNTKVLAAETEAEAKKGEIS